MDILTPYSFDFTRFDGCSSNRYLAVDFDASDFYSLITSVMKLAASDIHTFARVSSDVGDSPEI